MLLYLSLIIVFEFFYLKVRRDDVVGNRFRNLGHNFVLSIVNLGQEKDGR